MGASVLRQTTSAAPARKGDKHYDLNLHLPGQRKALGAPDRAGIVAGGGAARLLGERTEDPPKAGQRSAEWAMRDLATGLPTGFRRALPDLRRMVLPSTLAVLLTAPEPDPMLDLTPQLLARHVGVLEPVTGDDPLVGLRRVVDHLEEVLEILIAAWPDHVSHR